MPHRHPLRSGRFRGPRAWTAAAFLAVIGASVILAHYDDYRECPPPHSLRPTTGALQKAIAEPCPPDAERVVITNPLGSPLELCGEAALALDTALAAHGLDPADVWYMITFFDTGADGSAWDPSHGLPIIGVRSRSYPADRSRFLIRASQDSTYRSYYTEDLQRRWIAQDCTYSHGMRISPYPAVVSLIVSMDRQQVIPYHHGPPWPRAPQDSAPAS